MPLHLLFATDSMNEGERLVSRCQPMFQCVPGLERFQRTSGRFTALMASAKGTPHDWHATPSGDRASLVVGEAMAPDSSVRMKAAAFGEMWRNPHALEAWDGFHALYQWNESNGTLLAGCDRLGLFPLYYLDMPGIVAVSTSPAILRRHPAFVEEFDAAGLGGILMTRGIYAGRTLSSRIRRLEAGHVVSLSLTDRPREMFQWEPTPLPDAEAIATRPFEEHLEMFHEVFKDATRRHFAAGPAGIQLLSGGLDSRMVAGLLREQGLAPAAVTIGGMFQTETFIAKQVAKHLSRKIVRLSDRYDRHLDVARWVVDWEDLCAGFAYFLAPMLLEPARVQGLGERIFTGFQMDYVAGGTDVSEGRFPKDFDEHLRFNWNRLGWTPGELRQMLHPPLADSIDGVVDHARRSYDAAPGDKYQRAWLLGLPLRERHDVGINAWRASFCRWPAVLTLDEKVLRTCLSLPLESMAERRCQVQLVVRKWPDLARLPLDRNAFDDSPLLGDGSGRERIWRLRVRRRLHMHFGIETRFFHRLYEMDTPQWDTIRKAVEPGREVLHQWFEPRQLERIIPKPGRPFCGVCDQLADTVKVKTLLGLMMWASTD